MQPEKKIRIMVVDDDVQLNRMFLEMIGTEGYPCISASNGKEALHVLRNEMVDVVVADITMPEMDGIKLTQEIKALNGPDVILMTGNMNRFSYGEAISKGASDFIEKPFEKKELLMRLERVSRERAMRAEITHRLKQLTGVLEGVIHALSLSIDAKDPYTAGHQKRVANLAGRIADNMGLNKDQITGIRLAGEIHDLGKISIPAEILSKPCKLSEIEFSLIKTHPEVGYNILKEIKFPWPIAETIYQHHERMDGSGYPRGLRGKDILQEARILAVADVVEAIASHRPYRPALGIHVARQEIFENKGSHYDPEVVAVCLKIIGEKYFTL